MSIKDVLFREHKQIETLYGEYLCQWKKCTESFVTGMKVYLDHGTTEEFSYWCDFTHKMESQADDIRRNIERTMYSKAMIPESRGDILGLLEAIDRVINKVESVLFQIKLESIMMADFLLEDFRRIVAITEECLGLLYTAATKCFTKQDEIAQLAEKIDQKESQCDHVERKAIQALFESDIKWHRKFQLKELIIEMGNITDRAELVSDRMVITSIKRRV